MTEGCAVCGIPSLLTKCVDCGRRVCYGCQNTRYNLCADCAPKKGIRVRTGPRMWTAH